MSQRPREEEIPDECMTCREILECMQLNPKAPTVHEQRERTYDAVSEGGLSKSKLELSVAADGRVEGSPRGLVQEPLEKRFESARPSESTQSLLAEPIGNQFEVEDMDMLYASWSKTVRIDKQTLLGWGGETKEVEIETVKGKKRRCKVEPVEVAKKGVVQVPDKMQVDLGIRKGELVTVKPVNKK